MSSIFTEAEASFSYYSMLTFNAFTTQAGLHAIPLSVESIAIYQPIASIILDPYIYIWMVFHFTPWVSDLYLIRQWYFSHCFQKSLPSFLATYVSLTPACLCFFFPFPFIARVAPYFSPSIQTNTQKLNHFFLVFK